MSALSPCPPREQIARWLDDAIPPDECRPLEEHVMRCATCTDLSLELLGQSGQQAATLKKRLDRTALELSSASRSRDRDTESHPDTDPDFDEPKQLGPYRILAVLGVGGMGRVYLGWDTRLDREVAVKTLKQDKRFSDEARER